MSVACQKRYTLTVGVAIPTPTAFFKFEEAAFPFVDSVQGIQLIANPGLGCNGGGTLLNAAPSAGGKIGNCVHFNNTAPGNYTPLGDNGTVCAADPKLAYSGNGFTIVGWFKQPAFDVTKFTPSLWNIQFWQNAAVQGTFGIGYDGTFSGIVPGAFYAYGDFHLSGLGYIAAWQNTMPWADSAWHFFATTYDATSKTLKYRVDANAYVPNQVGVIFGNATSATLAVPIGNRGKLGTFTFDTSSEQFLDEIGVWLSQSLTDAQVDALYNGGVGKTYPFT